MENQKNPWKTINSKEIHENNWIRVIEDEVLNPKGNPGTYGVVRFKHLAIGIVPLDEQLNIWIVGQFRYPIDQYSWEIPEGGGDLEIDPLVSAKRELLEETGIIANTWTKIKEVYISNSCTDEVGIVYVARDLTFGNPDPEEDEELILKKLPFEKVYEMVVNGKITDALTALAIYQTKILIDSRKL